MPKSKCTNITLTYKIVSVLSTLSSSIKTEDCKNWYKYGQALTVGWNSLQLAVLTRTRHVDTKTWYTLIMQAVILTIERIKTHVNAAVRAKIACEERGERPSVYNGSLFPPSSPPILPCFHVLCFFLKFSTLG